MSRADRKPSKNKRRDNKNGRNPERGRSLRGKTFAGKIVEFHAPRLLGSEPRLCDQAKANPAH
jgi:hypothetical protein